MKKITIPMSPAINRMYKTTRNGGFYKTPEAKAWIDEAYYSLIPYRQSHEMVNQPVKLSVDFYFKRDRDIDSSLKSLLDLLQGRIYRNDSQIIELCVRKFSDRLNPRIEVELL